MAGGWHGRVEATGNIIINQNRERSRFSGHPSAEVPPGILNSILKQAGLK